MASSAITGPIFSDNKRAPAGTAAAPSFAFNDSTGTGVYLVSPGVLGLSTAGVQRVVVTADGNVGIGTASPGQRLHVNSGTTNGSKMFRFTGGSASASMYGYADSNGVGITNADPFATMVYLTGDDTVRFFTGATERMRIDASGNLHTGRTGNGASAQGNTLGLSASGVGYNESVSADAGGTLALWYMNRQSSNGAVIEFRRATAGVGSITVNASNTAFNTGPS
jgi:hypothetical protein